jgi:hypothetical protein
MKDRNRFINLKCVYNFNHTKDAVMCRIQEVLGRIYDITFFQIPPTINREYNGL